MIGVSDASETPFFLPANGGGMRSTLQALKEYQDVLIRIAELERLLSVIPPEVEELEKEWRSIQDRITELGSRKEDGEQQLKEKKQSLEEANLKASKFETDLQEVTNTREYHAALKEIDSAKKLIHTLQEAITSRKAELDENGLNMEECVQLEKESKARFESEMASLKESQVEHKAELEAKLAAREKLAANVAPRVMKQFKRIAERRNGVGLALCIGAICRSCNVRVRQNVVDELRKFKRMINCESCKRILFFADGEE
jgi:hypothetical protein